MISQARAHRVGTVVSVIGVAMAASPAWAGGIGTIGSPAFDNTCITLHRAHTVVGQTVRGAGIGNSFIQLPIHNPYQRCGGADLAPLPAYGAAPAPS